MPFCASQHGLFSSVAGSLLHPRITEQAINMGATLPSKSDSRNGYISVYFRLSIQAHNISFLPVKQLKRSAGINVKGRPPL